MKYYRASLLILFLLISMGVGPCPEFDDPEYFLVTRVIDGDTIELANELKIRYIGVDTPETVHPAKPVECYGPEATEYNKLLVEDQYVWLDYDVDKEDRYGRTLAYVYVQKSGEFVNAALVREGYARASPYAPNTKYKTFFAELEFEAKAAERGLWGSCADEDEEIDAEPPPPATAYAANVNSDVFHYTHCHYVDHIPEKNKLRFSSRQVAVSSGRRPCKVCKP